MKTVPKVKKRLSNVPDNPKRKYIGVFPHHQYPKTLWRALITIKDESINVGTFRSPEAAARARDAVARKYHEPERRVLNFPTPEELKTLNFVTTKV